ncbi:MAG: hypothetical protein ACI9NT_002799, partial [Bacteroidia bacterium]
HRKNRKFSAMIDVRFAADRSASQPYDAAEVGTGGQRPACQPPPSTTFELSLRTEL